MASYKGIPIYDESNYKELIRDTVASGGKFGSGFDEKAIGRYGSACPGVEYANVPRSEWKERIEEKERKGLFPEAWFTRGKVQILNQGSYGYCTTEDTQVLTNNGWKAWPDVADSDLLATVNQSTQLMEFQRPLARQVFNYSGEMIYSTNRSVKFGVTPGHRMYVRKWDERARTLSSEYTFTTAEKLGWYSGLMGAPRGAIGTEFVELEVEGDRRYDGDDLIALISLVCSDGYAGASDKTKDWVSFCCFHQGRRPMVAALAARVGFKEQPGRPGVWTRYSAGALANWMRAECYSGSPCAQSKRIPGIIKHASQRQIKLFLQFFGDQNHGDPGSHFYSSSRGVIDDLQELMLRIGSRASIYKRPPRQAVMKNGHVIRGSESWEARVFQSDSLAIVPKKQIERDRYNGNVYCATVPNGTLITRKDDSILISGNCWMFGVVGAMQLRYAMTGKPSPHLNPFYPAWLGKNGRNEGGWGGEALGYIEKYGVPLDSVFNGKPTNRAAFDRSEVRENAKLHKVWKFTELKRSSFQALMNMWLSDNPLPVSQAYNWWGHMVYGMRPVVTGADSFGTDIGNSWDYSYGNQGRAIIAESKADAAEQICVDMVSTLGGR